METDKLETMIKLIINRSNKDLVKDAFDIILTLIGNIISKPNEEKFRMFKKSNENLKKRVLGVRDIKELLIELGYIDIDEDFMAFQGSELIKLKTASALMEDFIDSTDRSREEQEEYEKQIRIKRNNEEIAIKFREEKEKQKKILEQMQNDKKENKLKEKPKDSVASNLGYGAKICKFEPKQGKEGGGG